VELQIKKNIGDVSGSLIVTLHAVVNLCATECDHSSGKVAVE
jgi:hypothetical protein